MAEPAEAPAAPPSRQNGESSQRRADARLPQIPDKAKVLEVGVVARKHTIAGEGRQEEELVEQGAKGTGRERMTETEDEYGKFHWRTLGRRIWQQGIFQRNLYSREKTTGQQLMAEGGLEGRMPYQFQQQLQELANQEVHDQGSGRHFSHLRDFIRQATLRQRDLHTREVAIMQNLRAGAQYAGIELDQVPEAQREQVRYARDHPELFQAFRNVLSGEAQAAEAVAQRVGSDLGNDILRTAIGEKRAGHNEGGHDIQITGELREYFNKEVIIPLLQDGLQNDGTISDQTLTRVRTQVQDAFLTTAFARWRENLPQEVRAQIDQSLSYGTDIVPLIQGLLPDLQGVKDHLLAGSNLKEYVESIVLKTNVGTLKSGAETTIGETRLEKIVSRSIDNGRVHQIFQELLAGQEHPNANNDALNAASARTRLLTKVGANEIAGGIAGGLAVSAAIYFAQRGAVLGSRTLLPFLGGSAAAGVIRGWQERARFTRDYEQYLRERAEGVTNPENAKRRRKMEQLALPTVSMQDAIRSTVDGRRSLATGNASQDDLSSIIGTLADRRARLALMNAQGVDLYTTVSNLPLDEQRTRLEIENVHLTRELESYFANNQHRAQLQQLQTNLGIGVQLADVTGSMIDAIAVSRRDNLETGSVINPDLVAAVGGRVEARASIEKRKNAFIGARRKAMAKQGLGTFAAAAGGVFVTQEAMAWSLRGLHALGADVDLPHQTPFERLTHWGHEPQSQTVTEALANGKSSFVEHNFKLEGANVHLKVPSGLLPPGLDWQDMHVVNEGNHFFLVPNRNPSEHLLGITQGKNGWTLDSTNNVLPIVLDEHLSDQIKITEHIPTIKQDVKGPHGLWSQYATKTPEQWYANDTTTPDLNELKFHTYNHNGTIALVPQNMQTSFEHGLIPESYYVPNVEHAGNMWYSLRLGGDPNNAIDVQAASHHGILWLNPKDHNPNHTYMTGNGKRIQEGVLARMFINQQAVKGLPNGDIATELTGRENVFNLGGPNGEAGIISQGTMKGDVFQSFATIHGTGQLPNELTAPGVPQITIEIPPLPVTTTNAEDLTDTFGMPFPFPRRPLEAGRESTGEEVPEAFPQITRTEDMPETLPYFRYGRYDKEFGVFSDDATIANILRFKGSTAPENEATAEGKEALRQIHGAFVDSSHVYVVLAGAIGDVVLTTAYIQGLSEYANRLGPGKQLTLVVPPNIIPLITPIAERYGYSIETTERYQGVERVRSMIEENNEQNAIVFEFDHHEGRPVVEQLPNNGLAVSDLFSPAIGLYSQERSGRERFSIFLGDLLSIPESERMQIYPRTELPAGHEAVYEQLRGKYTIDPARPQVGIVIEASHRMKRYSLAQWQQVIEQIRQERPESEINIFFNPNPAVSSYPEEEVRSVFGGIQGVKLVDDSFNDQVVLLAHQNVVLSNDTGLAHLAATVENGPQVVSLHLPIFPPGVWISDTQRHTGLTPSEALLTDSFEPETDDEARKWINRIRPEELSGAALDVLRGIAFRPPAEGEASQQPITPPAGVAEQAVRDFGRRAQESVLAQGGGDEQILRGARSIRGQDLTEEEAEMVRRNDPNWGEELALRRISAPAQPTDTPQSQPSRDETTNPFETAQPDTEGPTTPFPTAEGSEEQEGDDEATTPFETVIESPENLQETINTGLSVGTLRGVPQTFVIPPDILATYLRNSNGLFPRAELGNDLTMTIRDGALHVEGTLQVHRLGMRATVRVNDIALRVNDDGEIELADDQEPDYEFTRLPRAVSEDYANTQMRDLLGQANARLRTTLSQRVPPWWQVSRFSLRDGNIRVLYTRAPLPE